MSAEIVARDEVWARRITERIRYSAIGVRDGLEKLQTLMAEAQEGNAHELLGYASWTAYISEVMGEEPLRLARDERRDLVAWLSGQGMSTRAIAPIVGVDQKTVSNDLRREENSSPEPRPVADIFAKAPALVDPVQAEQMIRATYGDDYVDAVQAEGMTVNPRTGEVMDEQPVTETHTETHQVKTVIKPVERIAPVIGLDGKTYKRPEPKPVPRGDDANKLNAIQASKAIGNALESLQYLNYDKARHGIVTDWWPLGNHEVPPEQSAYFTPAELRKLAQGLIRTAELLEAQRVD